LGKSSGINPIPFIGGILAIVFVVLSIFVSQMAWGTWTQVFQPILGQSSTKTIWYNAFFGGKLSYDEDTITNFSESFIGMGIGVVVLLGGVLSLISRKNMATLGGALIIAGCIFWLLTFGDFINAVIDALNMIHDLENITVLEIFSGSRSYSFIGTYTFSWTPSLGFYGALAGGILSMVGGFLARE
jgi:hypothetical protein